MVIKLDVRKSLQGR